MESPLWFVIGQIALELLRGKKWKDIQKPTVTNFKEAGYKGDTEEYQLLVKLNKKREKG